MVFFAAERKRKKNPVERGRGCSCNSFTPHFNSGMVNRPNDTVEKTKTMYGPINNNLDIETKHSSAIRKNKIQTYMKNTL